jgi:flavin-dependent dehydrogenase
LNTIQILGGGLAGSVAAIAASTDGALVRLIEKSNFPRHKVCGEFLSPEIERELDALGLRDEFQQARPARIRRLILHLGNATRTCRLPEPAFGLSRFRLDHLLFERALREGAVHSRALDTTLRSPTILATGRIAVASSGRRLFGFKAHFEGPPDDAVELFFFDGGYVGINAVEDGITNVCGLASERMLRNFGFDIDALVHSALRLERRLAPLTRTTKWLHVGPLVFRNRLRDTVEPGLYPAGDALSFVDPFTGSGMLVALRTGREAGLAAARGVSSDVYVESCRRAIARPFEVASLLRAAVSSGWAERLARLIPAPLLFRLTRPHQ